MCIFLGQGQYYDRCITETAQVHMIWELFRFIASFSSSKDFLEASQQNSHQGNNVPTIVFVFFDGIMKDVAGWLKMSLLVFIYSWVDALARMGVTVVGQEFGIDDTSQTDTPLEIVQMMKGVTTVGDHMKQKVMQILHVAPSTRSVCAGHVIRTL